MNNKTSTRGYLHVAHDRPPALIWSAAFNGVPVTFTVLGLTGDADVENRIVARAAAGRAPGLYRVTVTTSARAPHADQRLRVRLGRTVTGGVTAEIATLERLVRPRKRRKGAGRRTPSTARLRAARHARAILDVLRRVVLPRTSTVPTPANAVPEVTP